MTPVLLLLAAFALSWAALSTVEGANRLPLGWPPAGVLPGLLLFTARRLRPGVLAASVLLILVSFWGNGYDLVVSLGYTLSFVGAAWLVHNWLAGGLDSRNVAVRSGADIRRLVTAAVTGSVAAGIGCGLTASLTNLEDPWLVALNGLGVHAAAVFTVSPLFLGSVRYAPLGGTVERMGHAALVLGPTLVVFASPLVLPLVFALLPMLAGPAIRGTPRDAKMVLMAVALIASTCTVYGLGPIAGLGASHGLEPEIVNAVLQLFLVDCGLILLPLSVILTRQRVSGARADAERETLERVIASAEGTAIIALDHAGLITLFNPGAEAILGFTSDEVLGTSPARFHPEGELERQASVLGTEPTAAAVTSAGIAAGQAQLWHFLRKDGANRVLRMRVTNMPGQDGEPLGVLVTGEDVTEREAAHEALLTTLQHQAAAVKQLQELERVKGDFVATVSHELRTPIASIIGYTEVLEDGLVGDLTEAQLEVVARVDRNGRRLLLLVEDLLTLSEIETSSLKIEPVLADIRAVVTHARARLEPLLGTRSLHVVIDVPETPVVHHSDPVQLERMVTNLLANAIKFTPDGGTVAVRMRSDGEETQIVVQDTGIGISEQDQTQLFTRFFRAATAFEAAVQGTGLGLTIVQAIVTMHGGTVEVSSRHGEGTTFTVTLPRVAVSAVAQRREPVTNSAATA